MSHLGGGVIVEELVQATVGAAIRMQEQDDPVRAVQPDRFLDLGEEEPAVGFMFGRSQRFGAACNNNWVGIGDPDPLQKSPQDAIEAMIEARHDNRIAMILLRWGMEMKDAFQKEPTLHLDLRTCRPETQAALGAAPRPPGLIWR